MSLFHWNSMELEGGFLAPEVIGNLITGLFGEELVVLEEF